MPSGIGGLRAMAWLVLLLAGCGASASILAATLAEQINMLNGSWVVEVETPKNMTNQDEDYLPNGTIVELKAGGAPRVGVANSLILGGSAVVWLPKHADVCKLGLAGHNPNQCQPRMLEQYDVNLQFERLKSEELEGDYDLRDAGARIGDNLVTVKVGGTEVTWRVWLQTPDRMLSKCTVYTSGKPAYQTVQMVWRRRTE